MASMLTPRIAERKCFKSSERTNLQAQLALRSVGRLLQNNALVAGADSDTFAVEVLEQRNGILTRNAGQIFKSRHVDQAIRLVLRLQTHAKGPSDAQ